MLARLSMDLDESSEDVSARIDGYPDAPPEIARAVLRDASHQLSERGLASAAKWALELLIYVPKVESRRAADNEYPHAGVGEAQYEGSAPAGPSSPPYKYATPAARKKRRKPRPSEQSPAATTAVDANQSYPYQSTPAVHAGRGPTSSFLEQSGTSPDGYRYSSTAAPGEMFDGEPDKDTTHESPERRRMVASTPTSAHVHFASSTQPSSSSLPMAANGDASHFQGAGDADEDGNDAFMLARSLFDHHQWERCISILDKARVRSSAASFLRTYARHLLIERRADEEYFSASTLVKSSTITRAALVDLLQDIIEPLDPFLLFLKGVVLKSLDKRIEAIDCFLRSIEGFPYNWSVWQELSTSLEDGQAEVSIHISY